MTGNFNIGKSWFKLAWLCVAVLLSICSLNVMGQVLDTSGPDRAYCVGTGNLYATTPGMNNGKPVCQFADNTWCDAHAFFTGNCSGNSSPYYANYNTPMSALDLADATKTCNDTRWPGSKCTHALWRCELMRIPGWYFNRPQVA